MDPALVYTLAAGVFAGGAAWGGAKVALNGTRQTVKEIRADLREHVENDIGVQRDTIDRLARIETKINYLTKGLE